MERILGPPPTSNNVTWNLYSEKEEFWKPIVGTIPSVDSVRKAKKKHSNTYYDITQRYKYWSWDMMTNTSAGLTLSLPWKRDLKTLNKTACPKYSRQGDSIIDKNSFWSIFYKRPFNNYSMLAYVVRVSVGFQNWNIPSV